mmetsp:Transcript_26595/g.63234  ORF Transcript_26595/g.63234 Transcript_26595/m.63234 type:complete len:123 (+) Transcript_26595:1004-1372(+)
MHRALAGVKTQRGETDKALQLALLAEPGLASLGEQEEWTGVTVEIVALRMALGESTATQLLDRVTPVLRHLATTDTSDLVSVSRARQLLSQVAVCAAGCCCDNVGIMLCSSASGFSVAVSWR